MFNQNLGDWSMLGKAMNASFAELHNINSRIAEQFMKGSMEMAGNNLASTIKHVQSSFKMRDPEDFINSQVTFVTDMSSKCLDYGKNVYEMIEGAMKDYHKCGKDGLAHTDCCRKNKD